MNVSFVFLSLFILASCGQTTPGQAQVPATPVTDPNFLVLANGIDLRTIKVSGAALSLVRGTGNSFGASQQAQYMALKSRSKAGDPKIQWVLMDLDSHVIVDQSANTEKRMFGASASKIFVAGTLLDKQRGELSAKQLQLMSDMLVISSNTAWVELQSQIGDGNSDRGRELNYQFTQRMGYKNTRGFQGNWGSMHGNELSSADVAEFLYDTYQGNYPGADTMWKIMHTSRTGAERAKKYMPADLVLGGKTGTYAGSTVDPDTGRGIKVDVAHQEIVFNIGGRQYALVVLADTGTNETAALLAGGLLREYTPYRGK